MIKAPHICHVTTIHPSKDMRIFRKECCSLVEQGYTVTLLVGNGESEVSEGVNIVGVPLNYGSRLTRFFKLAKVMYEAAIELNADVYHFHDPEFIPFARKLVRQGKKVVFDSHEDVGQQIMSKYYIPKPIRSLISWFYTTYETWAVRGISAIAGATDHIADKFRKYHPTVIELRNYPLLAELPDAPTGADRIAQIVYVGGISSIRCAEEMIDMLEYTNVPLQLGGGFSPKDLEGKLKKRTGWKNVKYLGYVGREEIWKLYGTCMAGLVLFKPEPNHMKALPNKMFEYMMAGIPVIASDFPMWRTMLTDIGCGVCVDLEDPRSIAKAIDDLAADPERVKKMGANGRAAVLNKYNWESEFPKLDILYKKLLSE